jgi:hypothetical protein
MTPNDTRSRTDKTVVNEEECMKKIKTYALSAVALGGMFLIGSLMHSRGSEAKGAYASPVQVMNTSAAPAIASSIDEPGRAPYVSSVLDLGKNCGLGFECDFNFTPVPAGHRLVVQEISGFIQFNFSPSAWVEVFLSASGATNSEGQFIVNGTTFGNSTFGGTRASFTQPFHAYFESGDIPVVSVQARNATFPNDTSTEVATLKGYLIDCTAAPCATTVH